VQQRDSRDLDGRQGVGVEARDDLKPAARHTGLLEQLPGLLLAANNVGSLQRVRELSVLLTRRRHARKGVKQPQLARVLVAEPEHRRAQHGGAPAPVHAAFDDVALDAQPPEPLYEFVQQVQVQRRDERVRAGAGHQVRRRRPSRVAQPPPDLLGKHGSCRPADELQ